MEMNSWVATIETAPWIFLLAMLQYIQPLLQYIKFIQIHLFTLLRFQRTRTRTLWFVGLIANMIMIRYLVRDYREKVTLEIPQIPAIFELSLPRSAHFSVTISKSSLFLEMFMFHFFSPKPKVQQNIVFTIISKFSLYFAISISIILSLHLAHSCILWMPIFINIWCIGKHKSFVVLRS